MLDVDVDGVTISALVDTGAYISVMSSGLRRRLKKVVTPAVSHVVRVADGGTPTILGMCTARVTIASHPTTVLFAVLEQCPYDVILGLDFLATHSALIDCATGLLQLELPHLADAPTTPSARLCSLDYVRMPPQAAMYISSWSRALLSLMAITCYPR